MSFSWSMILINTISILLIWGLGLYNLIVKNDEIMVVLMPLFTYLVFRKPKNKLR